MKQPRPAAPEPRYTLAPIEIEAGLPGWELIGEDVPHEKSVESSFAEDYDRNVEGAMTWAEQVIGAPQEWRHSRSRDGHHRWEA